MLGVGGKVTPTRGHGASPSSCSRWRASSVLPFVVLQPLQAVFEIGVLDGDTQRYTHAATNPQRPALPGSVLI